MIVARILIVIWAIEVLVALFVARKENKRYNCKYCGVYSPKNVVIKALPPFENHELNFCCEECKDRYIDTLLPLEARRYKHE